MKGDAEHDDDDDGMSNGVDGFKQADESILAKRPLVFIQEN